MAVEWLATVLPFIKDAKVSDILREQVTLLNMQRDDAIRELDKADAALVEATQQIAVLKTENTNLSEQINRLKPAKDLLEETVKILLHFYNESALLSEENIAQIFNLQPSKAAYHIDILRKKKFIGIAESRGIPFARHAPLYFEIMAPGRAYIVEKGLG